MKAELLALSYEELKARRDALAEMIREANPLAFSHLICDSRIPALGELDLALEVLKKARRLNEREKR